MEKALKKALLVALLLSVTTDTLKANLTAHLTPRPNLTIGSCLSIDIKPEAKRMDLGNKLSKSAPLPLRSLGGRCRPAKR